MDGGVRVGGRGHGEAGDAAGNFVLLECRRLVYSHKGVADGHR